MPYAARFLAKRVSTHGIGVQPGRKHGGVSNFSGRIQPTANETCEHEPE